MSDIIHLLPDSVANQIAAGEVIQRPSSVVKELIENALDAEATDVQVVIKDAGATLIRVIDNGKGMSETDARMAFERHATSKIRTADDLFALHTMGFRGEALASIAAVAQVELRTKRKEDEVGTLIEIAGSKIEKQEAVSQANGTSFSVKRLFFNIPARRKFLKKPQTELSHIINEFLRVALVYPQVSFTFTHNDDELYRLPESTFRQRIVNVFGKNLNANLLPIETETSLVKLTGFVGKPEIARKNSNMQYFFVNGRYMRHPYFHRAVVQAFDRMLPPDTIPSYFISFEIDPSNIDVNIHPAKTEIKFDNEQAIWQILCASIKEALGKFNVMSSIDFDREGATEIPVLSSTTTINTPQVSFNPEYNPFKETASTNYSYNSQKKQTFDWEKLYHGFANDTASVVPPQTEILVDSAISSENFNENRDTTCEYFQFKKRYILTSVKSGLMFIDQHRAHTRVLFEQNLRLLGQKKAASQQLLFPELLDLTPEECLIAQELTEDLIFVGFDIDCFGKNTYRINGIPPLLEGKDVVSVVRGMIDLRREHPSDTQAIIHEKIALSIARTAAIPYEKALSADEISNLINQLFACENHNYSPDGKTIIHILTEAEISSFF